jgi:hypothetical protein
LGIYIFFSPYLRKKAIPTGVYFDLHAIWAAPKKGPK